MSINKLALIRYKTIDHCLQNRFRKWTLDDLIEACSDAIYEYEGITDGISTVAKTDLTGLKLVVDETDDPSKKKSAF